MSSTDLDVLFSRTLHHGPCAQQASDLVVPPIVPAAVYYLPGDPSGPYQYGRWSNPTWDGLEDALGVLEDADVAAFPSGMAAISSIFYSQVRSRDRTDAERFINAAHFVRPLTSFGVTHTSAERRARWGDRVPAGFVRLSVGCEPTEVLWDEMERVLDSL